MGEIDYSNYNVVRVNVGAIWKAAAAEAAAKAAPQPGPDILEQHFMTLFGVADPAVLLPPGATQWETDRTWYHGGARGLEAGDLILPWNETGTVPHFGGGTGGRGGTGDVPGGCWVSTDPASSRYYASALPGGGSLYRVRPRGLIVDIENPVQDSFLNTIGRQWRAGVLLTRGLFGEQCCVLAEVLEVAERHVPENPWGARVRTVQAVPGDWPPLTHRKAGGTPLPPPRDPAGPYRICCVCYGNICRSPTAEVVLRDQLGRAGLGERVAVDSAGVAAERGRPMDPPALALLRRRRYAGGEAHRGRQFEASWIGERDLVLAMDASNLAALRAAADPADRDRIMLFGEVAGLGGAEVPNPWRGPDSGFAVVLAMLETGAAAVVGQLAAAP